jgi:retron-type reverse transcriptase
MPKRHGHLYEQIYDLENLIWAHYYASKGKKDKPAVQWTDKHLGDALLTLQWLLKNDLFLTGRYDNFTVNERGKERYIYVLPYFPDRILHHAILQVIAPIWHNWFINDTYGSIPGRGLHAALNKMQRIMHNDPRNTRYCLKCDIKKFYPSVSHSRLKLHIRRKIKDKRLLSLLDNIIDSAPGIPIGNYLSQYFGNVALTPFDHWLKERMRVHYYFRYVDDFVVFSCDKRTLHLLQKQIASKLKEEGLTLKGNWKIFPSSEGVDFLGYRTYGNRRILRKTIRLKAVRSVTKYRQGKLRFKKLRRSMGSWYGWGKFARNQKFLRATVWPIMRTKP